MSVAPCPGTAVRTHPAEMGRQCGSTRVSPIGYCLDCGGHRPEYDQEQRRLTHLVNAGRPGDDSGIA